MEQENPIFSQDNTHDATPLDAPMFERQPFEAPVSMILAVFALLAVLGTALGSAVTLLIGKIYGLDVTEIAATISEGAPANERSFVRWMLAFSHLGTFVLPGVLTLLVFYRNRLISGQGRPQSKQGWLQYLLADKWPTWAVLGLGALLMLVALPLVQYLFYINKILPLPEWMRSMEDQTNDAIKGILQMDNLGELLANLTIMALIPAIGEELVFRGILQKQLQRVFAQPWVAILVAGAIFSAIHMQFEGFIPRMLLGVVLGWLYWRTQNFWVPVTAHFLNNGVQVLAQFLYSKELSTVDLEQDIDVPWFVAVLSVFLIWVTGRFLVQQLPVKQ